MIVSIRDPNILSNLDPQQLTSYLIAKGWQQEESPENKDSIWILDVDLGNEFDINLPLNPKTRSFALRMAEILETLEKAEGRSQLDIVSDLVTNIPNIQIQGIVIQLTESSHIFNVIIMGFVIGKPQHIYTFLTPAEYQLARTAYVERLAVICIGDLIKDNGVFVLLNKSRFVLYDALSSASAV